MLGLPCESTSSAQQGGANTSHPDSVTALALRPWSVQDLRQYIAWAKSTFQPTLSTDAQQLLLAYYQRQRYLSGQYTITGTQVTVRLLEGLVRLAQAHARLLARHEVTLLDAAAVLTLVDTCAHVESFLHMRVSRPMHCVCDLDDEEQEAVLGQFWRELHLSGVPMLPAPPPAPPGEPQPPPAQLPAPLPAPPRASAPVAHALPPTGHTCGAALQGAAPVRASAPAQAAPLAVGRPVPGGNVHGGSAPAQPALLGAGPPVLDGNVHKGSAQAGAAAQLHYTDSADQQRVPLGSEQAVAALPHPPALGMPRLATDAMRVSAPVQRYARYEHQSKRLRMHSNAEAASQQPVGQHSASQVLRNAGNVPTADSAKRPHVGAGTGLHKPVCHRHSAPVQHATHQHETQRQRSGVLAACAPSPLFDDDDVDLSELDKG